MLFPLSHQVVKSYRLNKYKQYPLDYTYNKTFEELIKKLPIMQLIAIRTIEVGTATFSWTLETNFQNFKSSEKCIAIIIQLSFFNVGPPC